MDLDALINQLNRVEPEAINWRAMADLTVAPTDATTDSGPDSASDAATDPATAAATKDRDREPQTIAWVLEPALRKRLDLWLNDQNPAGDPGATSRILNQALEAWLNAHGV